MTEDLLRLITAAVDGELPPTDAQRLDRALAESPEARALLARLKADRARLRSLPAVQPPANLHKRIMAKVAAVPAPARKPRTTEHPALPNGRPNERTAEPAPAFAPPAARKRAWVPFAVAAGLLLCVTTGSFLFFVKQNGRGKGTRPADTETAKWLPADSAPRPSAPSVRERPAKPEREPVVPDVPPVRPPVPPGDFAVAPEPRPVRPDLIAFPPIPNIEFNLVRVRVPFLKTVADFEREDVRQQLAEELGGGDPAFRIDLFARDVSRGVEAFQAAAKAAGVTLHADTATLDRIRKQRQNNTVVVYTEALTAAQVAALFGKLDAEDARYSPRIFDVLHAVPATARDADELRMIFGVDPGLFKRVGGNERGEKGVEPGKSVSAATADEIVKSVTAGKGGEKEKVEKHAVLLTWSPTAARTPAAASAELKQFLAKRGPRPPNSVPVVVVIRPGNR